MSQSEIKQLLSSLRTTIKSDRKFFVAAQTDPTLESVRTQVDRLLVELTQEAETKAEKDIASAQSALSEMESWHTPKVASSQFQNAKANLVRAKKAFETRSYFGYLDSIPAAQQARKNAEAATTVQKTSMRKKVMELENRANSLQSEVRSLIREQYAQRGEVEAEFKQTLSLLEQAQSYAKLETYDGYRRSQESLRKCVDVLQNLHAELSGKKHLWEARYKRNIRLSRLHLAFLLMLVPSVLGFLFFVEISKVGQPGMWFMLWASLSAGPFFVLSDRIWSIGRNELGEEYQWNWLWLLLLNGGIGPICLIIALVTYGRGMIAIPSRYKADVRQAKRLRYRRTNSASDLLMSDKT